MTNLQGASRVGKNLGYVRGHEWGQIMRLSHEQKGDREKLLAEHQQLLQLARRKGLLKPWTIRTDNAA